MKSNVRRGFNGSGGKGFILTCQTFIFWSASLPLSFLFLFMGSLSFAGPGDGYYGGPGANPIRSSGLISEEASCPDALALGESVGPIEVGSLEERERVLLNGIIMRKPDIGNDERKGVFDWIGQIDLYSPDTVLLYGASVQGDLTRFAEGMVVQAREGEEAKVGDVLGKLMTLLGGCNPSELLHSRNPLRKWGGVVFSKLVWGLDSSEKLSQKFNGLEGEIRTLSEELKGHQQRLTRNIGQLNQLYEENLRYLRALELAILAGDVVLGHVDHVDLPGLLGEVDLHPGDQVARTRLVTLQETREMLDRRLYDLKLTSQIVQQALPKIQMMLRNDRSLIPQIQSALVNTVPLWMQQLALYLGAVNTQKAAFVLERTRFVTERLLVEGAEALRDGTRATHQQIQGGMVSLEALGSAQKALIEALEESLTAVNKGRQERERNLPGLDRLDQELRQALGKLPMGNGPGSSLRKPGEV